MSTEYVDSVTLYLGANEVEVAKINVKGSTGKKPVKTMNRTRRIEGFVRGVGQHNITSTVVVPTDDTTVDWAEIDDTKISLVPDMGGTRPTSYLSFCVTEAGDSYTMSNELVIDMTDFVTREVLG